jgi:hypothetical protein
MFAEGPASTYKVGQLVGVRANRRLLGGSQGHTSQQMKGSAHAAFSCYRSPLSTYRAAVYFAEDNTLVASIYEPGIGPQPENRLPDNPKLYLDYTSENLEYGCKTSVSSDARPDGSFAQDWHGWKIRISREDHSISH